MIITIVYLLACVMFWAIFAAASEEGQRMEPVYEDGKQHSGLLTEED